MCLSQHWIYDILLDEEDSHRQSAPRTQTSPKGLRKAFP